MQILSNNYDIIVLTETWLCDGVVDSEIFDDRYEVYRRDRDTCLTGNSKKSGGGVLIAVSNRFTSYREPSWESDCEDLWVTIEIRVNHKTLSLHMCSVYLPPPVNKTNLESFLERANEVLEMNNNNPTIIVGDFNLSGIRWTSMNDATYTSPTDYSGCSLKSALVDFMSLNSLNQYNTVLNHQNKILDLILCNDDVVTVCESSNSLKHCDKYHPPIDISINIPIVRNVKLTSTNRYNFYRADYERIVAELDMVDWYHEFLNCNDINEMLDVFYTVIGKVIKRHVPVRPNKVSECPVWYTPQLKKLLHRKYKCHLKVRKYHNPLDELEFRYLRRDCDKLISSCYKNYICKIENEIGKNPKYFWTHLKNLRKFKSAYPPVMTYNGVKARSVDSICDLFAENFSTVYENDNADVGEFPSVGVTSNEPSSIMTIELTREMVYKKLKRLDLNKGPGPDGVPPLFLSRCADPLSMPLFLIFNRSIKTGQFPDKWKVSKIVPIHKSGRKEMVCNYRPISIISTMAKVFESLVFVYIYNNIKHMLHKQQHGFVSQRSTTTNLLLHVSLLCDSVDMGNQVDVVYTDFSKAFDKVNHKILVKKLSLYGISNPLLAWCESYLSGRFSTVVIDGHQSKMFSNCSGVPQGSNLGPLFFNIFINDIIAIFKCSTVSLFADDLKLARVVRGRDDQYLLQGDIDRLTEWCRRNRMYLNIEKCYHIKFTRKKKFFPSKYSIDQQELTELTQIRDLGVILDSRLTFGPHIDHCLDLANKSLGFIMRSSKSLKNPLTILKLFSSLVRSRLEYCSIIWSPYKIKYITRLESVQKRLLRRLSYRFKLKLESYVDRLKHFNIDSLQNRRDILAMNFLYKVLNNKIDCPDIINKFAFYVPPKIPRQPCRLLDVRIYRTQLGKNSPVPRMSTLYNNISKKFPSIDICHDGLPQFKRKVITCLPEL